MVERLAVASRRAGFERYVRRAPPTVMRLEIRGHSRRRRNPRMSASVLTTAVPPSRTTSVNRRSLTLNRPRRSGDSPDVAVMLVKAAGERYRRRRDGIGQARGSMPRSPRARSPALQHGQDAMGLDRIGRRVAERDLAVRVDDADGADAGRALAERGPDLAQEDGDGGLAVGAGDGGYGQGCAPRTRPRYAPARARGFSSPMKRTPSAFAVAQRRAGRAQPRRRARRHPSGIARHWPGAGERGKEKSGPDVAAVARESGEIFHRFHGRFAHSTHIYSRARIWSIHEFSRRP